MENPLLQSGLIIMALAVSYYFFSGHSWPEISLLLVIAIFLFISNLFKAYKDSKDQSQQFTIYESGIQTPENDFVSWSEISDEKIIEEGSGKSSKAYFVYHDEYAKGMKKIPLDHIDISRQEFESLIKKIKANKKRQKRRKGTRYKGKR